MQLMLSGLMEQFFAYITLVNRPSTVDYYERHLRAFLKAIGDKPAAEMKRVDVTAWANSWHRLQTVQRLFSWAVVDAELLPKNPFATLKKPLVEGRARVLSRSEILRLLRGARKDYRDYLLALRESLARPQEIRDLCWEMLHTDQPGENLVSSLRRGEACFVLAEYKARRRRRDPAKPRVILITARLGRLLVRILRNRPTPAGRVFRTAGGEDWTTNALRLRMRRLREKLHMGPDHRGEAIVAYSFRHTQATFASSIGIRDRLLAELMGHTSTRTTARYQHLEIEDLRKALKKMESFRKKCA